MARTTLGIDPKLLSYLIEVGVHEDHDLRVLREETAAHPLSRMQISPEQGQFMALLASVLGAKRALEIGTFTGYSAMWLAKAMGENGRVVTLEVNEEYAATARRHWSAAGLSDCITIHIAPAAQTLSGLLKEEGGGTFDFVFIDANKTGYDAYYEFAIRLVRRAGLIAIDNVLREGKVIDPLDGSDDTAAIRALNKKLSKDSRVILSMVPIGDGLTLACKR